MILIEISRGFQVKWLDRKFEMANSKRKHAKTMLEELLAKPNPFWSSRQPYDIIFFANQWEDQQNFHWQHSEAATLRYERLAIYFEKQEQLRKVQ